MTFHSPHLLWLLAPLVLLFSWELARRATGGASALPKVVRAWAGAFSVSLGSRHSTAETRPRIWLWFGLAFCIVAAARPQWGVVEEQVFDQSREVIIAADLSRSMLVQDVRPSRLDRARLLITSMLDRLEGERVGLVLFAGTAFLQSPLSSDYEILREFLPALQPDFLPEGGSNYRAMLETSIQAFGTSAADRYLIVLGDGESSDETWRDVLPALRARGIRVIGLGIGTPAGGFVPDGAGAFVKDERGAVVLSRLNASTLQELAQTTSGAYADASAWVDLPALLRRTVEAGQQGQFTEQSRARKVERFQWFLAPGLLLLLLSYWAEFPVRPRERALPLGRAKARTTRRGPPTAGPVAAALAIMLTTHLSPATAGAAEGGADTLAKPLTTTVARLADKAGLTARDFADLAQATVTYGQRLKSGQQLPPEGVVRDALAAVGIGEQADPKAADWQRLRGELEELLEKPAPPPPPPPKDQQQKQDRQEQKQDSKDQQEQQDQQQKQEQPSEPRESADQKQDQQAFGEMQAPPPPAEANEDPPPPEPQMQKVGGQEERQPERPLDPELAVPLQKLDQLRDQDSPARLQRLMQGQAQPKRRGKDW